jgi:hypothetical protein
MKDIVAVEFVEKARGLTEKIPGEGVQQCFSYILRAKVCAGNITASTVVYTA